MNNFVIRQDGLQSKQINIPVQLTWDYLGIDLSIDEYETQVINEVIGKGRDFEVSRFAHAPQTGATEDTAINYEFSFYSGGSVTTENNWAINYINQGFTPQEVYYYANNFANSFFKLDLYDSPDEKRQTNYLTVIIPTQQGLTMTTQMQRTTVSIKKPKFVLDYIGDKEGFFIYWLKKRNFLDIDTFYMTAKFYDAKIGQFVKMTNRCQGGTGNNNTPYTFNNTLDFYYEVKLDYPSQTYQVIDINPANTATYNQRVGTTTPIKWWEYVNP